MSEFVGMSDNYTFGELLVGFRSREGMSQAELAKRLGMGRPTISGWESGKSLPRYVSDVVGKVADIFSLSDEERYTLLRAYPNNPEARKAIKAQAKCRKAM